MKSFRRDTQKYIIMALNSRDDDFVWTNSSIRPLKELVGRYKGIEERTYLVPKCGAAMKLAHTHSQESILVLSELTNGRRTATIVSLIGEEPIKGEFKNVGHTLPNTDGYTLDTSTGDYYVFR